MTETTEIVEAPLVSPADPKRVLEVMKLFEDFKKQALTPNDYVILDTRDGKKPYLKKSAWMKYALACQLSLEKRDERLEERPDGSKIFHYTYRAVAPNGRYADAVGSASTTERTFTHPDHDVRALAQTRACNRAISNLVAGGEVSAEEMVSDVKEATRTQPEAHLPGMGRSTGPEDGSLNAISDEALAAALEKLPWRPNKSGKEGWNVRWDDVPQQFRAKLGLKLNEVNEKQYVKLGGYGYRRFGDTGDWLARYLRNEVSDAPTPKPPIKESDNSWKVPTTAAQASPEQIEQGVRQTPLGKGVQSFGMVNILGDELALCPERPVPTDNALIDGFLLRKIVEPLVAKHKLAYTLQRTNNGFLEAVLIRGKLDEQQIKELVSGSRWAFERALSPGRSLEEKKA